MTSNRCLIEIRSLWILSFGQILQDFVQFASSRFWVGGGTSLESANQQEEQQRQHQHE